MKLNKEIPLTVYFELGKTKKTIRQLLGVGKGSVYRLDESEKDIVSIYVEDKQIGKGKILISNGKMFVEIVEVDKEGKGL